MPDNAAMSFSPIIFTATFLKALPSAYPTTHETFIAANATKKPHFNPSIIPLAVSTSDDGIGKTTSTAIAENIIKATTPGLFSENPNISEKKASILSPQIKNGMMTAIVTITAKPIARQGILLQEFSIKRIFNGIGSCIKKKDGSLRDVLFLDSFP
jgi:hypothetical protein